MGGRGREEESDVVVREARMRKGEHEGVEGRGGEGRDKRRRPQ